jgi:hypothetical protein
MKLLIGFLVAAWGLAGQTVISGIGASGVSIGPQRNAGSRAGTAMLGFVSGPGPAGLKSILGVFGAAHIGPPLAIPASITHLYLSSRQRYALVEQTAGGPLAVCPLAVWMLGDDPPVAIAGAMSHPDAYAFSPRGQSAALYSSAASQIEIITGLPANPVLKQTIPLQPPGAIVKMAVSDDASVLLAQDSTGELQIASLPNTGQSAAWHPFSGAYSPLAWSFVPKTHDLVVSDSQPNAVLLIEQADRNGAPIVLAENCHPDQISITSNGETLVALDSTLGALWTIDLKSRTRTAIPSESSLHSLTVLRNGYTFLASSDDSHFALLKVSDRTGTQTALVQAGIVPASH